ncbi:translocation/assembly module TamB domain-containing protein [Roseomonas sp. BN140053]|uniref:translocation/assembly module TamB domain-containing protein n=1 Tax=Roseomonas sp. BN140053 TaxID=3391898 RepID=UPI0039EA5151
MRRWIVGGLLVLLLLPVLLVGGALVFLNVGPGQAVLVRLAASFMPGLTIEGLHGRLPDGPRISRIVLSDAQGPYLVAEDAALDLDLGALLHREVRVRRLSAGHVVLSRLPVSEPEPEPAPREPGSLLPSLPQLPVGLALEALEAERLEIGEAVAGRAAVLNVQGGGRLGQDGAFVGLRARRLDAPGSLDADLALAPGQRVKLALSYDEPAGGMVAGLLGVPPGPGQARIALDGPAEGAALTLSFQVGDGLSAEANGTLALPADGGLGLQARGTVRAPALLPAPLTGGDFAVDLRPEGSGHRLNALTVTAAPGQVDASGLVGDALDLRLRARLGDAAALGALLPAGLGWSALELDGSVTGSTSAPAVDARAVVRAPRIPNAPPNLVGEALTVSLRGDLQRIEALELSGAGISLSASGQYRDPLDLRLRARMGDAAALGDLLPDGIGWAGLEVEGTVSGTTAAPAVDARATLRGPRLPGPLPGLLGEAPTLALRGDLNRIEHLELTGAGITATASGSFRDPLDLSARLTLANTESLGQPVRGQLQAELRVAGTMANPSVQATVTSPVLEVQGRKLEQARLEAALSQVNPPTGRATLRGRLEGQPLSLDAASALDGTTLRIETLTAALGPVALRGNGAFDTARTVFDGEATLEARDLAPLSSLAGTPLGGGLRLEARMAPDARGVQGLRANLRLNRLSAAGTPVDGTVQAEGTLAALNLQAQVTAAEARLNTRARLALLGPERRVELAALDVTRGQLGVRLTAPAAVVLGADGGIRLPGLSLATRPGGSLRLAGQWGPERADLRATIASLPASIVNIFAPDPPLAGSISGDVRVAGTTAAPAVEGELRATGLRAQAPWAQGLPAANLTVNARTRGQAIEAQAELRAGTAVSATLAAQLPRGAAADAPLQATLRGNADLGVLASPFLAAGANRATGRLSIDAQASGTVSAPRLSGGATLAGGSFRNLEYGIALRDIAARLRAEGDRVVLESLTARGGQGTLSGQGQFQPFAAGQPVDLTVTARGLQPAASDLFTGVLDAGLRLDGGLGSGMRLSGQVEVQSATLGIPENLPGSVADLGEVRERGRGVTPARRNTRAAAARGNAAPPAAAPPMNLDLSLNVPGRFYVRGRGLDAEMAGRLRVGGTISAPDIEGALRMVRGTFTVLDRRLTFGRGNLTFSGPVLPELDFLASSNVSNTTVSIAITGSPTAPKIEFTSSPELPQDEVLARLLFRRSTSQLSPFQIAQIAQVLAGATGLLSADPGGGLVSRVARSLGLDRLGVGTGSTGALGVEAGGYLGSGIYLNVDPGATTGQPRVGVEVELTPRLKLESSTGTDGQSAGLSYEYEY